MNQTTDSLAAALDSAADTADAAAAEQRAAADTARAAARERRAGRDATARIRSALEILGGSADRVVRAAGAVRRTWVHALVAEGHPIRRIAETLGVSHQRVSALRNGARPGEPSSR